MSPRTQIKQLVKDIDPQIMRQVASPSQNINIETYQEQPSHRSIEQSVRSEVPRQNPRFNLYGKYGKKYKDQKSKN